MKDKAILQMTANEIYLDYVNNFLTIKRMAEYYNVSENTLNAIIETVRTINNN